jgi:hypothetical protein
MESLRMRSEYRGAFYFETKLREGSYARPGQQEAKDLQGKAEHTNDKIQKVHGISLLEAMVFSFRSPWRFSY